MLRRLLALGLMAVASQVNAILIATSVGSYDVSTVFTSYSSSPLLLESQVWWGSRDLPFEFAALTGDSLGFPNSLPGLFPESDPVPAGAAFGYIALEDADLLFAAARSQGNGENNFFLDLHFPYVYAIATAVPEPGTLSLFAAGLVAFVVMRRRKRLRR
jgi:PEP-CTERM motif